MPVVRVALTFGGPGGGVPFTIVETEPVPLSPEGNLELETQVQLPPVLAQPIVLIRIGSTPGGGGWIAVSN